MTGTREYPITKGGGLLISDRSIKIACVPITAIIIIKGTGEYQDVVDKE
jgi:hypothetical protein